MSGGHFDYREYRLNEVADELEDVLAFPDSYCIGAEPTTSNIAKLRDECRKLFKLIKSADYMLSADSGEDEFNAVCKKAREAK
jgi:hypothetical protein